MGCKRVVKVGDQASNLTAALLAKLLDVAALGSRYFARNLLRAELDTVQSARLGENNSMDYLTNIKR